MSADENLKSLVTSNAAVKQRIGDRMYFQKVPGDKRAPYVWYRRSLTGESDTLDAAAGESPFEFTFDMAVVSEKDYEAEAIAELIRGSANSGLALNNYRGTFGSMTAQGIFVTEQSVDYEALGIGEDSGLRIVSLSVRVML